MADPAYVTGPASPQSAAYVVDLIREAAALAVDHFATLPDGEEATAYVLLTAPTGYGVITLGMWGFNRDSADRVTLLGATPEEPEEEGERRG
ncbi:hypothetical protein ACOZDE_18740 [Streptomyces griseoincarnatus]